MKNKNWSFFVLNRHFANLCPINWINRENRETDNVKSTFQRTFSIFTIRRRYVFVDWPSIWQENWPINTKRFDPRPIKMARDRPVWTKIHQNCPWLVNLDANRPKRRKSVFVDVGPNWLIEGCLGGHWSKSINHGVFWKILVKID